MKMICENLVIFRAFFLIFAKSTGVSLQNEASEGKHDGTKRTEISGWRGASVLPTVRQSHCAEPDGQAQEILLRRMPQAMVESPPDAGALEICAQGSMPGLREGISRQPGIRQIENLLQSRLREPRPVCTPSAEKQKRRRSCAKQLN